MFNRVFQQILAAIKQVPEFWIFMDGEPVKGNVCQILTLNVVVFKIPLKTRATFPRILSQLCPKLAGPQHPQP